MAGRVAGMPTAKEGMETSYANAAQALASSHHAVEGASKARLHELLQLSARGADESSNRSATHASRCSNFDAFIASKSGLPPRLSRAAWGKSFCVAPTDAYWPPFSSTTLLFLAMAAIYSSIAWHNTARWVAITQPIDVPFLYPDGSTRMLRMGTDKTWPLVGIRGDRAVFRFWYARQGYQEIDVPSQIIAAPRRNGHIDAELIAGSY